MLQGALPKEGMDYVSGGGGGGFVPACSASFLHTVSLEPYIGRQD